MAFKSKIKTVEDAFNYTGKDIAVLAAFKKLPNDDRDYMVAAYKRSVVTEALNKEANKGKTWKPDWTDGTWKYQSYVWLKKADGGVGFVVAGTHYDDAATGTHCGSRLCFKTSELVDYFNEQFADLLQVTMAE
ncbi:MAG TPA: hypothetical protein PK431_01555 [Chitinophagales bacterium]|nr:hypothetical protein [Chitinophagales bacterium]